MDGKKGRSSQARARAQVGGTVDAVGIQVPVGGAVRPGPKANIGQLQAALVSRSAFIESLLVLLMFGRIILKLPCTLDFKFNWELSCSRCTSKATA